MACRPVGPSSTTTKDGDSIYLLLRDNEDMLGGFTDLFGLPPSGEVAVCSLALAGFTRSTTASRRWDQRYAGIGDINDCLAITMMAIMRFYPWHQGGLAVLAPLRLLKTSRATATAGTCGLTKASHSNNMATTTTILSFFSKRCQ